MLTYQIKCTWAEEQDFRLYQMNLDDHVIFVQALPAGSQSKVNTLKKMTCRFTLAI